MDTKTGNMPPLSIIVAVDGDGGFGKDGKIPWYIPADMRHFMEVTKDSVCIMGRKTYEDMLKMVLDRKRAKITPTGSPPTMPEPIIESILPGRTSFVVTSNDKYEAQGATAVPNIRAAVQSLAENDKREIFVLGGRRMYIEALSWTDTVYLTLIKGDAYDCDIFFPIEVLNKEYKIVDGTQTEELYFVTYKRG